MASYLQIHTKPSEIDVDDELGVEVGDKFVILAEEFGSYFIAVNGVELEFTLEPDEIGYSYKTWFDLVE